MTDAASANQYWLTIDGYDIGQWTECSGLSIEFDILSFQEGGQNAFEWKLPGRRSFGDVTLKRPIDKDSSKVTRWLSSSGAGKATSASITLFDPEGAVLTSWRLSGVRIKSWTGPTLKAGSTEVASESLKITHEGFQ